MKLAICDFGGDKKKLKFWLKPHYSAPFTVNNTLVIQDAIEEDKIKTPWQVMLSPLSLNLFPSNLLVILWLKFDWNPIDKNFFKEL